MFMSRDCDTAAKRQRLDTYVPFTPVLHATHPGHLLMSRTQFGSYFSHLFPIFMQCKNGHLCKQTREMTQYLPSPTEWHNASRSGRKYTKGCCVLRWSGNMILAESQRRRLLVDESAFPRASGLPLQGLCPLKARVGQRAITRQWDTHGAWRMPPTTTVGFSPPRIS